jgi:lysophospholipase L1-like esterase
MIITALGVSAAENVFAMRDGIPNVAAKLKAGKPVTVVYFGGSITAMNGWRNNVDKWLKSKYPNNKIKMVNAGLGGTGSELGVFRMDKDVLAHKPDLIFVEFAVNDNGPADDNPELIQKTVEGIVRKIWKNNPSTDIVFFYTIHKLMAEKYDADKTPNSVAIMEKVADHYGIASINGGYAAYLLGKQQKLNVPGIPWKKGSPRFAKDDCHPLPHGHKIYGEEIGRDLSKMLAAESAPQVHKLPKPLRDDCYEAAQMLAPSEALQFTGKWTKSGMKRFKGRMPGMMTTSEPGATATIEFKGSTLLFFDVIGPDTGQYAVTVDGKDDGVRVRFDKYCRGHRMHWQSVVSDLDPTKNHKVTITVLPEPPVARRNKNMKSKGTVINIGGVMLQGELIKN